MFNGFLFAFALLLVLTIIVRRFFSRNRGDLDTYIRQHEEDVHSRIEAMRLETRRFGAHEALAPVEAGLRELLDLHGHPGDIALDREDDALVLRAPDNRITVVWDFRAASRSAPARPGHIYGKGQWELRVNEDQPEPYTQLDSLMGRLSPLVRALAGHEPLAENAEAPCPPGHRQNVPFRHLPKSAAPVADDRSHDPESTLP